MSTSKFAALGGLSTPALSDALDRLGVGGQCTGLQNVGAPTDFYGRAFTVQFAPVTPSSSATVGDYIDDIEPGDVIVLANGGQLDATVWGELLSCAAALGGAAGTVIDGVCRDTQYAVDIGYPIWSRGRHMRTGKDRVQTTYLGGPVRITTAQANAGDLVVGDRDGVVIIPASSYEEVVEVAIEIDAIEARIRAAVLEGMGLRDARKEYGYFKLQRKEY